MKTSFILSISFTAILSIIIKYLEKYYFNDVQFIGFMGALLMGDAIAQLLMQINQRHVDLVSILMDKAKKSVGFFILLSLSHVLVNYEVNGIKSEIFSWIDSAIYGGVVTIEAIYIIKWLQIVFDWAILKQLMKFFKGFDSITGTPIKETINQ
jgi:hypothetical protein